MPKDSLQQLLDNLRAKGGSALPTSSLGRLQKTASAAARIGMGALAGRLRGEEFNIGSLSPEAVARLVETLGELKGVAMKAGQILSYVDGSLSPEARRLLEVLQVMSQPAAFSHIQRTIVEDLGPRGRALLARLEREPVASASIGQVHRAVREDGTRVAVKVRHPGIEEAIRADFRTAAVGTFFAHLAVPGANVDGFVAEAEARFLEECNYALEARRQIRFREIFAGHPSIAIPAVHLDACGPRVLTSTWHDGAGLDAFLGKAVYAAERVRAARALYEFYVGTLYRHGLFNADPHPGNLLFAADGRVTILDHGCVREFEPDVVTWLARLSRAVRADDARDIQTALAAIGMTQPWRDFDVTRAVLRGFYAPLLETGRHRVEPDQPISMAHVARLRKNLARLRLPGKLMFLFRVRVGLYAVLARMGARLDWIDLEDELAASAARPIARAARLPGQTLPAWRSTSWRPEDAQPSA
jgi:predicted unusual protein kinase regulating ubiquinone biosynthesis (AarF/ABC1/UbiB family)